MKPTSSQKDAGAYYTPDAIVTTLLSWAIHDESDRFLDPACGDGRFIAGHTNTVGIEQDAVATCAAMERAPWALVHEGDFFTWAAATHERFNAAGGNPPFIRYQTFAGDLRARALTLCHRLGANFTGLTSSWAPFLVASAGLLQPGGRMAFVVPAEIGHAPYAAPLLEYLAAHFELVHIIALREKLFPELSEDCWLLYAEGFGGVTTEIRFTAHDNFHTMLTPPRDFLRIVVAEWRNVWNRRLRPFLMPESARDAYAAVLRDIETKRFKDLARIGIGYVTGNNDFFHLRPSEAKRLRIPKTFLRATVRKSEVLPARRLYRATVERWRRDDEEILLLNIPKAAELPGSVRDYLDSAAGKAAREAYKCRMRTPWYSVPDVQTPGFFLSYMSGLEPSLVRNDAGCTCTNSVHAVRFRTPDAARALDSVWDSDFLRLSCELEGHPLGGGLLKLEPGEAARIVVPAPAMLKSVPAMAITEGITALRAWRHYGGQA
jgi:adenine-specific DNA-methyltransferase